jgi:tetratricopeptide (TPR) repeat protein
MGDWFSHSVALSARGDFLFAAGEFDAARRNLEEGVRAAREVGDLRNIARGLSNLGKVALAQRGFERARRTLEEALSIQRELGDSWGIPRTLVALGVAAHGLGDDDQTDILFDQGLRLQLEADDRPGMATSLEEVAALAAERDDHEGAACLYGAAAILREMVGRHPLNLPSSPSGREVETIRDALSPEVFANAWSRGRSMTLDEAVAYALDRTRRNEDVRCAH